MAHGKRLRISLPMLILLALLILTDRTGAGTLTLLAAFLHECGHFAAARGLGLSPRELRLDLLGARMEISGRMLSYGEEFLLAAAGPLASFVCSLAGALLWEFSAARIFSAASLLLGLLNLLPIRTFDGGRMLEATLSACMGVSRASLVMRLCSFAALFLLWLIAVYFLLRAADGLSLLCFTLSLFFRFFDGERS